MTECILEQVETLEQVEIFCAIEGVLVHKLSNSHRQYAKELLEQYSWQTSARYIAMVCHPSYFDSKVSTSYCLADFFDRASGFKEPPNSPLDLFYLDEPGDYTQSGEDLRFFYF